MAGDYGFGIGEWVKSLYLRFEQLSHVMKNLLFFYLFLISGLQVSIAQGIEWARSIGNVDDNVVTNAIETPDGKFIVFSTHHSIIKIDQEGNYQDADYYLGFEFFDSDTTFYTSQKVDNQLIFERRTLTGNLLARYEHTLAQENYSEHFLFEDERFAIKYEEEIFSYDFENTLIWNVDNIVITQNSNSEFFREKIFKNKNDIIFHDFEDDSRTNKIDPLGNISIVLYSPGIVTDTDPETNLQWTNTTHRVIKMKNNLLASPLHIYESYISGGAIQDYLRVYNNEGNQEFSVESRYFCNFHFSKENRTLEYCTNLTDRSLYLKQYDADGSINYGLSSPDIYFGPISFADGKNGFNVIFGHNLSELIIYNMDRTSGTIASSLKVDGENIEKAYAIFHLSDDQYIIVGHSTSNGGDIPYNNGGNDVFIAKINMLENYTYQPVASINQTDTFCLNESIILNAIECTGCNYTWSTGENSSSIEVPLLINQTIYLTTTFPDGSSRQDSFLLVVAEKPTLNFMISDSLNCIGDDLNAAVTIDQNLYYNKWFTLDSTTIDFGRFNDFEDNSLIHQLYSIPYNCNWTDSIPIYYRNTDRFSLSAESQDCFHPIIALDGEITDSSTIDILWSNGDSDYELVANQGNYYAVEINNDDCSYRLDTTLDNSVFEAIHHTSNWTVAPGSRIILSNQNFIAARRVGSDLIVQHLDMEGHVVRENSYMDTINNPVRNILKSSNGLILIYTLQNREVFQYDPSSSSLLKIELPFQPSAINISERNEIIIISNSKFARLTLLGDILYETEVPLGSINNINNVHHIGNKIYIETKGLNVNHRVYGWDFISRPTIFQELPSQSSSYVFFKSGNKQFLLAGQVVYELVNGSFRPIREYVELGEGVLYAKEHNNYNFLMNENHVFIIDHLGNLMSETNHSGTWYQQIEIDQDSILLFTNRIKEKIKLPYRSIFHQDLINTCDTIPNLDNTLQYQFSTGNSTFDFTTEPAGQYWVEITDEMGCKSLDTFVVNDQLNITTNALNVPIGNRSDGLIEIQVENGIPPYTYTWSNGERTRRIENLQQGNYTVTVTDAAGCETIRTIELNRIRIINDDQVDVPDDIIIFPIPSPGPIIIFPRQQSLSNLSIINVMGKKVMDIPHLDQEKIELDLSHLMKGIYFIRLESNGRPQLKKIILH